MTTPADPEVTARIESDLPFAPASRRADGQFAPGTIVAGRYRIASILGSGGMGEVYRADDIKLDQLVALKFLPARLARDPILLGRMHDEVRLGRQIAHPNVCRIYDIVESGNAHFVSMEHVDGEDLSRLLRRIGRLAHDKAVDLARGIAAGLMAAHGKGILHRDLKPANVMIDSFGEARIMDFGLALLSGEDDGTIAGTPAYMAPEQLQGEPATVQSDLYALGLVMYELFTGKRAHSARTMPERVRDATSEISTPSSVVRDIDPTVERVILRCLEPDPAQRPRSAREVINSLPGGDPLAAALAAGETPSPRLVAAAGTEGGLKPWQAWTFLSVALLLLVGGVAAKARFAMGAYTPFDRSPDVLTERAATILREVGVPQRPMTTHAFSVNGSYLGWILESSPTQGRWERLRSGIAPLMFTLTESATPRPPGIQEDVSLPSSSIVNIDSRGRLVSLVAKPVREWTSRPLDWRPLFVAAGLDQARFTSIAPALIPESASDAHAAWSGVHPDDGTPIRVEAAAWRGRPVFFRISGPWEHASTDSLPFARPEVQIFVVALGLTVVAIGVLLAWRNLRAGRGDRQGAFRLASLLFVLDFISFLLLSDHHLSGMHEVQLLQRAGADSLLWAAIGYVLYLALEPFVRRRWPALLIASTRVLNGQVRDPLVGRDVLIGLTAGLAHTAAIGFSVWLASRSGGFNTPPFLGHLDAIKGGRFMLGHTLMAVSSGALHGFIITILLVVFMMILRRRSLAALGLATVFMVGFFFAIGEHQVVSVVVTAILVLVAARYGLLAVAVAQATFLCIFHGPFFSTAGWQNELLIPLVLLLAVAVSAFRTSLGAQSPFSSALLDG